MSRILKRASGSLSSATERSREALSATTASNSVKLWAARASMQGCR